MCENMAKMGSRPTEMVIDAEHRVFLDYEVFSPVTS
jgi:hypothetical protein